MKKTTLISILMLLSISIFSQNANTLGAKIYINSSTPVQFLDFKESKYSSSEVNDSLARVKVRGGLNYDALILLDASHGTSTIYLWNDSIFEAWERPIKEDEKVLPSYYCSSGLKSYILSQIRLRIITNDSKKMENTPELKSEFEKLKAL